MASIGVGDSAPDFTKTTQNGDAISLSQYRGDKAVVLYFYPKSSKKLGQIALQSFAASAAVTTFLLAAHAITKRV